MPGEFDMRRMQEEAARRAREMQSRARMPQPRHTQGEGRPSKESPKEPPKAPAEAPPPPPEPAPAPQGRPVQAEGANSLLENLFKDKERTIILALLILLGSEEGNQELLFALLFLLMGPRACSFWVEMPISAPRPNSPPSVKRVEAFTYTAALSACWRKRWALA